MESQLLQIVDMPPPLPGCCPIAATNFKGQGSQSLTKICGEANCQNVLGIVGDPTNLLVPFKTEKRRPVIGELGYQQVGLAVPLLMVGLATQLPSAFSHKSSSHSQQSCQTVIHLPAYCHQRDHLYLKLTLNHFRINNYQLKKFYCAE